MKRRTVTYLTKSKALKILERPMDVDLHTLLSANFAISRNHVVRNHIQNTLMQLGPAEYKLSA
jgi:hypothetical protein